MTLWLGFTLLLVGAPLLGLDRKAAHYFRYQAPQKLKDIAYRTTDWAKGGPWIILALLFTIITQVWLAWSKASATAEWIGDIALALLASFVTGSVVLHIFKLFLGRRRPRDDFEHGLYGFVYFTWSLQYNSFPSGHAMTIFCVATLLSALMPSLTPLWFAAALYFGFTRAVLTAHFLSDVAIGAAIGVTATREVLVLAFPQLAPVWF